MYPRLPRFALFLSGGLVLLAGFVGLSLELINRLLLHHRPLLSLASFVVAMLLVFMLGLLACHAFGLNRWVVLPVSLLLSALLLIVLLFLTHCGLLPLVIF